MPATKQTLDFTNVKDQGNFNPKHKPAGDYKAKIAKVEDYQSNAGNKQWLFTIELASDKRATYPYYCGFDEKQLFKVRNLFLAVGKTVPKKRVGVDPNPLVGKEIAITLDDDEYEGKLKSVITATFPVSELTEDEPADDDVDGMEVDEEELDEL